MIRPLLAAAALLLASAQALAQALPADPNALIGHPLLLRGAWVEDNLHFDGSGHATSRYTAGAPVQAGFDVRKVHVSGNSVRLEGIRMWLLAPSDGVLMRSPANMGTLKAPKDEKVTVTIEGATDMPAALAAVFTENLADLAPAVPFEWKAFVRSTVSATLPAVPAGGTDQTPASPPAGRARFHAFRCPEQAAAVLAGHPDPSLCPVKIVRGGPGFQRPSLLHQVEPEFSELARRLKFSGNVLVYVLVDASGAPTNVQIVRPAGLGLDEQAVKAVSQYRFRPATLNGTPVATDMQVEVKFQIF